MQQHWRWHVPDSLHKFCLFSLLLQVEVQGSTTQAESACMVADAWPTLEQTRDYKAGSEKTKAPLRSKPARNKKSVHTQVSSSEQSVLSNSPCSLSLTPSESGSCQVSHGSHAKASSMQTAHKLFMPCLSTEQAVS